MTLTGQAQRTQSLPAYGPRTGSGWRVAAVVAVLVATLAHVWVARSAFSGGYPTFNYDEIDTLLAGRAALGIPSPQIGGAGYFPLSAILVAPLWWVTSDPFVFYRVVTVIGVLTALVTIWPLARIATRFGVTVPQAVTVAAAVLTLPARTLQADYALAEKTVFVLLTLTVLAAVRLGERPTTLRAAVLSALVALTYFCHARMLVVVVAAAVWLALFAVRRWQAALVGLVTLLPLAWAVNRLSRHIAELLDPSGFTQAEDITDNLALDNAGMLLRTGLGQAWGQIVASFGLAALGLTVAVVLAGRELRGRSPGPALLALLSTAALFGGSVLDWGSREWLLDAGWRRLDVWIYGRYADPAVALLVLIALCAIVRGVGARTLAATWALVAVVAVPTLVWLAPQAPTGGFVTPAHVPGAMPWWWSLPHTLTPGTIPTLSNDNRFWLVATLTALVPLAVLTALRPGRWRAVAPTVVAAVVIALGGVGSAVADRASDRFQHRHPLVSPLAAELRGILADHPDTTVGYDDRCPTTVRQAAGIRNRVVWQLLPTVVSRTTSGVQIAIACGAAGDRLPPGGIALEQTAYGVIDAWIMPGPLQHELLAEGVIRSTS